MSAGTNTYKVLFAYKDPSGNGTASGTQKIGHVKDEAHARRIFKMKYADRYPEARITRVTQVKSSVDDSSPAEKVVANLLSEDEGWPDSLDHGTMVEILTELDFEVNDYKTVKAVNVYRDELDGQSDDELRQLLASAVGAEANDASILAALREKYPDGTILSHNSPFHQWGGQPDEDEEFDEED
jgi:hypothetical protein